MLTIFCVLIVHLHDTVRWYGLVRCVMGRTRVRSPVVCYCLRITCTHYAFLSNEIRADCSPSRGPDTCRQLGIGGPCIHIAGGPSRCCTNTSESNNLPQGLLRQKQLLAHQDLSLICTSKLQLKTKDKLYQKKALLHIASIKQYPLHTSAVIVC